MCCECTWSFLTVFSSLIQNDYRENYELLLLLPSIKVLLPKT